jgi:hypothetical protein
MARGAKLFSVIDVVAVNTETLIDDAQRARVAEIVHHVAQVDCLPLSGTPERAKVVNAVRAQLPNDLANFGRRDLAELTIHLKWRCASIDRLRVSLCRALERRFGKSVALTSEADYRATDSALAILAAIVESPRGWKMDDAASVTDL